MLTTVAQAVVNGLLIGGIYALVSIGVTLIFGVVKVVNFAHGEFVMIGMYISFFLATHFGIDPLASLVISMPVLFAVGVLLQHFLIRRVLGLGDMPQIFLTFALSLLLMNVALMVLTADYRTGQTPYSDMAIHIGAVYVSVAKLIAFAVAMVLSGALWLFLHTTDIGKAMCAAAQNQEVAMLMGINPDRVFCVAVGVALAGAADSLIMSFYPAYPMVGQVFVLMAFVAVVLGTLGNITGALWLGALVLIVLGIAHVPEGRRLFPEMTVKENLEIGAYIPSAQAERSRTLEIVFNIFPVLADRQKQLAGTMSDGERQMLAVGRGLMLKPRLLMLDEPSLGLAPVVADITFQKIQEIHTMGTAVLLVEQNVSRALSLVQRAYVLESGKVIMHGTSAELENNKQVQAAYLGI
jgi:branched-chain amino acid transport system permease protein